MVGWCALGLGAYALLEPHDAKALAPWILGCLSGFFVAAGALGVIDKQTPGNPKPLLGPFAHQQQPGTCPMCKVDNRPGAERRAWQRTLSLLSCACVLSWLAQNYQWVGGYGWPLLAACLALTGLVGIAALEPTSLERRERRVMKQRGVHQAGMQQLPL